MTPADKAPTIDECIANVEALETHATVYGEVDEMTAATLAFLRAHKEIMEAKRPEPVAMWVRHGIDFSDDSIDTSIDAAMSAVALRKVMGEGDKP